MATRCPKCNAENPDTQSFCGDCGTQLGTPKDIPVHTKTFETPLPQFSPGTSLAGRYEIIKELGKGGMGEVYLAEDTNLKRKVAIKVLPKAFSLDKEKLARFEREARLLASLNHPNIATIHGLEKSHDQQFLVMELVEGDTLAERIYDGPLPIDDALEVCKQIAEGLESAHEKGIIHRDLKPGNIKFTAEGKVKILDFGLAKPYQEEQEAIDLSKSPTLTDRMTQPGVILGTAAYMSPEQARSQPVDKITDIWAFGCLLYECLTGERVFQGETVSDTLAYILKGEPDWTKLPSNTPPSIRTLLRRCLQKDKKNRLHDIADARIEIVEEPSALASVKATSAPTRRIPLGWMLAVAAVMVIVGILIRPLIIKPPRSGVSAFPVRSIIEFEPGQSLDGMRRVTEFNWPNRTAITLSHDGTFMVYSAFDDKRGSEAISRLYMRRLGDLHASLVPGTEGAIAPFLSPDDRWVGFWADSNFMKIPIEGGVAQKLCESNLSFGADWGDDGSIVFASSQSSGLFLVSAEGGDAEILTVPDQSQNELGHRLPSFLPGSKDILFTIMRHLKDMQPLTALLDMRTKEWQILLEDASDARYVASGHIVFLQQGVLMVVPFDLKKKKVIGRPISVVTGVMHALNSSHSMYHTAAGQYSVSSSGSLAYATGGVLPDRQNELYWVDMRGNEEPVCPLKFPFFCPRLSSDGKKILYQSLGMERHIYLYDIERDIHTNFISEGYSWFPLWSPDGKSIYFNWTEMVDPGHIYRQAADKSTERELIFTGQESLGMLRYPACLSRDGTKMAFLELEERADSTRSFDIMIYDFLTQSINSFAVTNANETHPDFSPDDRWLAYCSDETGRREVFVSSVSGPGVLWQVSREGGSGPIWARNGRQLYYRSLSGEEIWVVDIQANQTINPGSPRLLFEINDYLMGADVRNYDQSLDENSFLMVKVERRELKPVTELVLIHNWFEEVKRLVPTGK